MIIDFTFLGSVFGLLNYKTMNLMNMKALYHNGLAVFICFSLTGRGVCGESFCVAAHNNTEMCETSHKVNNSTAHSHWPSDHEFHQVAPSRHCCQVPLENHVDCIRNFVFPNKSRQIQGSLITTSSTQFICTCFQFSEMNLNSEIQDPINPTLQSLSTVILLE